MRFKLISISLGLAALLTLVNAGKPAPQNTFRLQDKLPKFPENSIVSEKLKELEAKITELKESSSDNFIVRSWNNFRLTRLQGELAEETKELSQDK